MRMAARICSGPRQLLALAQSKGGSAWRDALADDLGVLRDVFPKKLEKVSRSDLEDVWRQFPVAWSSLVRSFVALFASGKKVWEVALDDPYGASDGKVPTQCPECDRWFESWRACHMHRVMVHSKRQEARLFAGTSVCFGCHRDFRSRLRLVVHLAKPTRCGILCRAGLFPRVEDEEVRRLDAVDAVLRRDARRLGVNAASGPPVLRCSPAGVQ